MWVPRWLGEAYAKLYVEFGKRPFTLSEMAKVLKTGKDRARILAHHLHKKGLLLVFERKKPRLYRLLSPENMVLLASGRVRRVSIPQERYVQLIYDCFRAVSREVELTSFIVYGSVARGEAKPTSDLDLLVISDSFEGSLGERIERLLKLVKKAVSEELEMLRRYGYYTLLSFYPLRREEAAKAPILLLDLTEDAVVVYDSGFFSELMEELKRRLARLGAKRIKRGKRLLWDLKPDYKPLEVIPL